MLFSPSSVKHLILGAAVIASLSAKPSSAQDVAPCDQFAWPVKREQVLFASKELQHVASGATLDTFPDHGTLLSFSRMTRCLTRCHLGARQRSRTAPAAWL